VPVAARGTVATEGDPELAARGTAADARIAARAFERKRHVGIRGEVFGAERERAQRDGSGARGRDRTLGQHAQVVTARRGETVEDGIASLNIPHDRARVSVFFEATRRLARFKVATRVPETEKMTELVGTDVGARGDARGLVAHEAACTPQIAVAKRTRVVRRDGRIFVDVAHHAYEAIADDASPVGAARRARRLWLVVEDGVYLCLADRIDLRARRLGELEAPPKAILLTGIDGAQIHGDDAGGLLVEAQLAKCTEAPGLVHEPALVDRPRLALGTCTARVLRQ